MGLLDKLIFGDEVNNNLYKAIYSGDSAKVNVIIDSVGLSYRPQWAEGYDLLITAIECKHVELAKLLMNKGCKIVKSAQELSLVTIIHLALKNGDCELVSMLLDGVEKTESKTDLQSLNLLHLAVTENREDIVRLLQKRGEDFKCQGLEENTPIHVAAVKGQSEILELLLEAGFDIDRRDENGNTGLSLAVSVGNRSTMTIFLDHGANCKLKNKKGLTPLLDATSKGYTEIVEDLLAFGADINDKNELGLTPLHMACMLKNKHLIGILLNAGADINATDCFGIVPCETIFKKLYPRKNYICLENPYLSYFLVKHLAALKVGGFYLNKKNESFYDTFYDMYCNNISVGLVVSPPSQGMTSTIQNCKEEISKMKTMKSSSGFTVYDVFKKLKNPKSLIPENEIQFLQSIDLKNSFPTYENLIKNHIGKASLRNELITLGQEWLSFLNQNGESEVNFLPEEMRIHILSFLDDEDIKRLIDCGEEINKQRNSNLQHP